MPFLSVKHKHNDQVATLYYEHIHKSIRYVTMQLAKSTHQQVMLQQNTQNTSWRFHASEKNQWFFLLSLTWALHLRSQIFLFIQVPLQKFQSLWSL